MQCPSCSAANDVDALFCSKCGGPLGRGQKTAHPLSHKVYLYTLVLVPALLMVAGLGYYKFFLPDGTAAVVNGEEIKRAELDAAVPRARGIDEEAYRKLRYEALTGLINERLILQEAHKAGLEVSEEEMLSAAAAAQAASGLDETLFLRQITSQYGSGEDFEKILRRRVLVRKFLFTRIAPRGADPRTVNTVVDRWVRNVSDKAVVRINLSEQWSGSGCKLCGNTGEGPR